MTVPVVVVTGGSGGIGRAVVTRLHDDGWRVVSLDTVEPPAAEATDEAGPQSSDGVLRYAVDISDSDAVSACVHDVVGRLGQIDALVNNAAILECFAVHDTTDEVWARVLAVNLTGPFLLARACLPHLRNQGRATSIVNVSSVHALASVPRTAVYAATKGALLALTRQMAIDYADDGVRVNAVVVGSVDTNMSSRHGDAIARDGVRVSPPSGRIGRMAQPAEIAGAVAYLLGDDASFVTGASLSVDGGLLAHLM